MMLAGESENKKPHAETWGFFDVNSTPLKSGEAVRSFLH